MKKYIPVAAIMAIVALAYSCKKNPGQLSDNVYLDLPATTYNYIPAMAFVSDTTATNCKATVGRVLFYDSRLSVNNALSCASCHKQAFGFADNVPLSSGFEGMPTKRNSRHIVNITGDEADFQDISFQGLPLFWDGRVNVLEDLVSHPITNHVEMGVSDFTSLPAKLSGATYYRPLIAAAYGDSNLTAARIAECISTFLVSIRSQNTRFDQLVTYCNSAGIVLSTGGIFTGGGGGVLNIASTAVLPPNPIFSNLETEGYNLFFSKYNCGNCHHLMSSAYGEVDFHDIGLDKTPADMGLGTITGQSTDNGKFKVPDLRNVALTAPYMHDGRYKTLSDVIDHYSHSIQASPNLDTALQNQATGMPRQMNITDNDKQALIAFLNTLTDYQLITDPKFSNPFKAK